MNFEENRDTFLGYVFQEILKYSKIRTTTNLPTFSNQEKLIGTDIRRQFPKK